MTLTAGRGLPPVATPGPAAAALDHLCPGRVHLPGSHGYEQLRVPWNLAVDQRPAAVVLPRTAREVGQVVRAAAAAGLRVAPQSTGHNAGPLAARGMADVVLLRMSSMTGVSVDPARGVVRVEGGTEWLPAVEAAAQHGGAVLHGSSPDVGIAGYSLGGGLGWFARKLGLATNSLTAVEVVVADGTLVRADATTDAQLFWAVRGGGGSFGVVTALEFRMSPVRSAYAGMLVWDLAHAERVLRAWSAWAPDAADEVTTSFRVLRLPAMPELPAAFRGRSLVVLDGAVLDADEPARRLLTPLRDLAPEVDTFDRVPARSLVRLHMDPEGGAPVVSDTAMLAGLPDAGVDAFVEAVGPDATTSLLMAELRQLGGRVGRPQAGAGVLGHLEGSFVAFGGAMAATPETAARGHLDARSFTAGLAPYANGRQCLNLAENPVDPRAGYADGAWLQLTGIRSAVDPDAVFVANHPIPRLYEDGAPTS